MSALISGKIINHTILQTAGHSKSVSSASSTREGNLILLHNSANNLLPFALASPQNLKVLKQDLCRIDNYHSQTAALKHFFLPAIYFQKHNLLTIHFLKNRGSKMTEASCMLSTKDSSLFCKNQRSPRFRTKNPSCSLYPKPHTVTLERRLRTKVQSAPFLLLNL